MNVFYAFNNTQIVNMVNTKLTYYNDEESYLIVRGSAIISSDLITAISNTKVFHEIYMMDMFEIDLKTVKFGKVKVVRSFIKGKLIKNYYTEYLKNAFHDKKCDRLFIVGGWTETVYIADFFKRNNSDLKLIIVEDGTIVYSMTRKELYNSRPMLKYNKKFNRILNKLVERRYAGNHINHITKEIYVWSKQEFLRLNKDKRAVPVELKRIDDDNIVLKEILESTLDNYNNLCIYYDKRKVIYLADYIFEEDQNRLLNLIFKNIKPHRVIVKTHTGITKHRLEFAKSFTEKYRALYVDRNCYFFEALNTKIDFSNKVLISRGSTVLLYSKLMFGYEPYIILTYKLFKEYMREGDINLFDDYVDMLKNVYENPKKIMVPVSTYEFEEMLNRAYLDSLGY